MDVATGPCVPVAGRKRALAGVMRQEGPETPEQMRALFTILGGSADALDDAMQLVAEDQQGQLFRCSERFVQLMKRENLESIRLGDEDQANGDAELTQFVAHQEWLNAAWMTHGNWHSAQRGTQNKLGRTGWARIADEKSQPLYCWYGPPILQRIVVMGRGEYPRLR